MRLIVALYIRVNIATLFGESLMIFLDDERARDVRDNAEMFRLCEEKNAN